VTIQDLIQVFSFEDIQNTQFIRLILDNNHIIDLEFSGSACNLIWEGSQTQLNESRISQKFNTAQDSFVAVHTVDQSISLETVLECALNRVKNDVPKINMDNNNNTKVRDVLEKSGVHVPTMKTYKKTNVLESLSSKLVKLDDAIQIRQIKDEVGREVVTEYRKSLQ